MDVDIKKPRAIGSLTLGAGLYSSWFQFNQANENTMFYVEKNTFFSALGWNSSSNYTQRSEGLRAYIAHEKERVRYSLTYGLDQTGVKTFGDGAASYFRFVDFNRNKGVFGELLE